MDEFFRYNILAMTQTGFWPLPNTKYREFFRKLNCVMNIIMSIIVLSSELWEGFDNMEKIPILIEGIVTAATAMINMFKAITFLVCRDDMTKIINMFKDFNTNIPVNVINKELLENTDKWKKKAHNITKVLVISFLFPFTFYMTVPWYRFIKDNERIYPFPSKFPLDKSVIGNWLFLYWFEFIMAYILIWTFISSESFFANSVLYICSRLEILKYSLDMATKEAKNQGRTTKQFDKTIEYHKSLLISCEKIEYIYSPCLLFQFFISTILLCMLCFLTTLDINFEKQLTFLSFFSSMLVQLFVYCYFGQLLENKFEEFWNYGFHSSWYDTPISYQKDVKFFLLRCSKPVTLTAYKIMPVNMESYYAICKTSISYLTMLQSMNK